MHDTQNIRLAALDRAITLHCSTPDASKDAADIVRTAETLTAFIKSGNTPDAADPNAS